MSYVSSAEAKGGIRFPRHRLEVNGAKIPLVTSTVTRKSTQNADTFTADIALGAATAAGIGLAEWADWNASQTVSVYYSTQPGGADETLMISGTVDRPEIKLDEMTISVSGRDKSSKLTENRRNTKFLNQKSSDIAKKIAQDNGLNPVVVDTADFAGKAYTSDVAHLIQNRVDYEVMSLLAQREGYRWYVEGDNLYFEPKTSDGDVYAITYVPAVEGAEPAYTVGTCLSLTLSRNAPAGRPTTVEYVGWHHGKKKLFKAKASAGGVGDPLTRRYHHNGNTQEQLEKKASSKLKDIIRHELGIIAVLPGDLSLDPRMQVALSGTGTVFDQTYQVDSIDFAMGWDGFTMTADAKGAKEGR